MKKGWMMGVGIVVSLAACGTESEIERETVSGNNDLEEKAENVNHEDAEDTAADDNNEEADEEEMIEEEDLGIGTMVNFNGLEVTLKEAFRYEGDGDWVIPDQDFFVILDVSIENTTEEAANISSLMQMDLLDAEGYAQDLSLFVDTRGSLDGEVGAGRTMAGELAFDVDESPYFEFIFEDPFMSGQAIWEIEGDDLSERE
ncbi:DUF4352 domain-containing protein [Salisediminibacterium beveridgei]|uniref:DUF4352 domain-containing protein n=1 Tax=Salisediminibacterium beveridgei TaxID=632773 RepID=A0A1D7QT41_9BACI|nr:DUF4352 domain-containing protein [Salisediminibacterium beveridgei]AOM82161.1 hypothetical protein BBEV_0790 [Salisediminibacterium beveridgei]